MRIQAFSKSVMLAGLFALTLLACNPDGLTPGPTIEAPFISLNLDGDNLDAPILAAGTYEAGVRLSPAQLSDAEGGTIPVLHFYIAELPTTCSVRLYQGTNADGQPDSLLYNAVVSTEIEANRWNEHALDREVRVPNDDLWLVIRFTTNAGQPVIGCDPGPAVSNGDWIYSGLDDQWLTLRNRSGNEISINWNIRAVANP